MNKWYGPLKKGMKDTNTVALILQRIVLVNLIAFCFVMAVLIIARLTTPTKVPPPDAPSVFDRAQKYD